MSRKHETESTKRDASGKYAHGLDAVCMCGKRKGEHSAERPHDCDETGCEGFKRAK